MKVVVQFPADREDDAQIINIIIRYFPRIYIVLQEIWMIKSDFSFPFFHNTYMTQPHRHTQSAGLFVKIWQKKIKYGFPHQRLSWKWEEGIVDTKLETLQRNKQPHNTHPLTQTTSTFFSILLSCTLINPLYKFTWIRVSYTALMYIRKNSADTKALHGHRGPIAELFTLFHQ